MVGDGWLLEAVRVFMLYPAPSPLDCIFSSSDSTHIYTRVIVLRYISRTSRMSNINVVAIAILHACLTKEVGSSPPRF
jgi:hypothetical protein